MPEDGSETPEDRSVTPEDGSEMPEARSEMAEAGSEMSVAGSFISLSRYLCNDASSTIAACLLIFMPFCVINRDTRAV